jgi:hypothetical protein
MFTFIRKIKETWNDYGFEIVIVVCIVLILSLGIYHKFIKKSEGSWTKDTFNDVLLTHQILSNPSKMYNKLNSTQNYSTNLNYHSSSPSSNYSSSSSRESKGETECRRVLQMIFNRPFNKSRPDFLRNPVTGNKYNLELDCYDHQLKLAVEYNGEQHYNYIPYFHKNKEAFLNQKYRDDMKRRICKENNIVLIEVPYTIKTKNIANYIKSELVKSKYLM